MAKLLFTPLQIRELTLKNRIVVSPMCQYSAVNGVPNKWHLVHLGSRAVGGAGVVMAEATGVSPEARISPSDTGIWDHEQRAAFADIVEVIKSHDSVPAIQLAHAGRKASCAEPWNGGKPLSKSNGGWVTLAPSAVPFGDYPVPREMTKQDIDIVAGQFVHAAENARKAGFEIVEIHMAHGYLFNEFLSPLSNKRIDEYGGPLENRMRLPLRIANDIRRLWPKQWPVFVRISATDWMEGGFDLDQSIVLAKELKEIGIDLVDCSSGGNVAGAKISMGPGYQVPFSEGVRKGAGIKTGAVGLITEPHQAEQILEIGQADLIFLARELLRDPYWPLHAAKALNVDVPWPKQYERAKR